MEIIDVPRGFGKTTLLLNESARTEYPIVVGSDSEVMILEMKAKELGLDIPTPIIATRLIECKEKLTHVLVDELPHVLSVLFGTKVDMATMTSGSRERHNCKKQNVEASDENESTIVVLEKGEDRRKHATCSKCDSVLEYGVNDTFEEGFDLPQTITYQSYVPIRKFIICPECGNKVRV